jgi:hypothetical protein
MVDMKIVYSERKFGNFTEFSYTSALHTVYCLWNTGNYIRMLMEPV